MPDDNSHLHTHMIQSALSPRGEDGSLEQSEVSDAQANLLDAATGKRGLLGLRHAFRLARAGRRLAVAIEAHEASVAMAGESIRAVEEEAKRGRLVLLAGVTAPSEGFAEKNFPDPARTEKGQALLHEAREKLMEEARKHEKFEEHKLEYPFAARGYIEAPKKAKHKKKGK